MSAKCPLKAAAKARGDTRFQGKICKKDPLHGTERMTHNGKCAECHKISKRAVYRAHSVAYAASARSWRRINPERQRETLRKYRKNNRAFLTHLQNLRHAKTFKACPKWVDKTELRRIYENCPEGYEVDHIMPLSSPVLCGLHVPWNLWYLPNGVNQQKSNKILSEAELALLPGIYP